MNYYNASGQMDLSDRIAIETGICIGESFKKIAKRLRRLYRPPKVRPKNLTIGGRYFYG